ncbi:MAG TPA: DUF4340 domain-containing protein [Pseudomonadales bacterium]|jgi:hypothetical protein|nr:DUF4340 domain-containing protein [Pseudomonadales bacterium]
MNRHVKALSLVLAVQLAVLAGVLFWNQRAASTPAGALLQVDRAKVDGIVIVDEKGAKLKLQRAETGWTLPDSRGLPADGEKVGQMLDKLIAASAPWPVATSSESAKRFEVAADKFQREIQLLEHDKVVGDLYFGTSPGFKKVHVRRADSDDVYAVAFANYEATARADDWLDKALLKPNGDVTALTRPDHWTVQRDGEVWSLDAIGQGETTKQDVVADLVNKVVNLRVLGAADAPAADAVPVLLLTARTANGEFDYRFYQPQPKSDLIVTRNGQDGAFKVAAYVGEPLIKERGDLVASTAAAPAAPAALKPTANPAAKPAAKATGSS